GGAPLHVRLEPGHRRGWGSFSAALHRGAIPAAAIEALLAQHPLAAAAGGPLIFGVDTSGWPRRRGDAERGRRGDEPRAGLLSALVAPLPRPTDCGGVVVPVGRPTQSDPPPLDRPAERAARAARHGGARGGGPPEQGPAGPP